MKNNKLHSNLLAAVVTTGVLRPMAESAAIAMGTGSIVAEAVALATFAAFGLRNHVARGVCILALFAETAAT